MNPDERASAIEQRKAATGRKSRQWVRGAFTEFDIYRVPVELLVLNAGNRRFHAEKLDWEEQLGRALDPIAREVDERSVISILLDDQQRIADDEIVGKPSKDALALMSDWTLRGQEQPLWIRPDGFVVNGNRRLAALKRLGSDRGTATGTFSYVEAVILPFAGISDDEMFQMEAREQLTEGYKVRYGDLNVLLTLREAAIREGIVWTDDASVSTVAHKIQDLVGNNPSYAEVQLRTIRYMDEYLEYTGEPGRYQRMIGQVERFRDIGKNMSIAMRETPEKALDLLETSFRGVQAGLTHLQLRDVRKLAIQEPGRFDSVVQEVDEVIGAATDPSLPVAAAPARTLFGDDDGDSAEDDPTGDEEPAEEEVPVPTAPSFPRRDVKRVFEIALEDRQSRQRNDVEAAIREAAGRLEQVTPGALRELIAANKAPVRDALSKIRAWVELVRDVDA